jgi:S1-C subfamily serine protease
LILVILAATLAIAGVAWSSLSQGKNTDERLAYLQEELARREAELAASGIAQSGLENERRSISAELARVEEQLLSQAKPVDWAGLSEQYQHGIFLCVAADNASKKVITGTAFAVDGAKGVLVTNAHVARAFQAMPVRRLIQNGSGAVFSSVTVIEHPRHRGARSPDLAIIIVTPEGKGAMPIPSLPLASPTTLLDIKVGIQVGTLGFPGELTSQYLGIIQDQRFTGTTATFKTGWVGRLTNYSGASVPAEDVRLIQHSASLSQGTSGSPLFTTSGEVIGVTNAAAGAQVGGGTLLSAAEIGFAIRSDELSDILVQE